jgi:hypothetical protein
MACAQRPQDLFRFGRDSPFARSLRSRKSAVLGHIAKAEPVIPEIRANRKPAGGEIGPACFETIVKSPSAHNGQTWRAGRAILARSIPSRQRAGAKCTGRHAGRGVRPRLPCRAEPRAMRRRRLAWTRASQTADYAAASNCFKETNKRQVEKICHRSKRNRSIIRCGPLMRCSGSCRFFARRSGNTASAITVRPTRASPSLL